MSVLVKRTLDLPAELLEELGGQAAARGTTVSALLVEAAQDVLRRKRGLEGVAVYKAKFGAFTQQELAEADRILDEAWGINPE